MRGRKRNKSSWGGNGDDDADGCGGVCLKYEYESKRERDCVCWLMGGVGNGLEGDLHLRERLLCAVEAKV